MTSDAERECYYRLTREAVGKGAIIEFGAWLGASTAYIAAAVRDSGGGKVHVYDKFQSKKGHVKKVRTFYAKRGINEDDMPLGDAFPRFQSNLGPLMEYIEPHQGQIAAAKWGEEPIALIISDAPKRVPEISAVLTNFRKGFRDGTVMAWQDFCHFPSYEIPACLFRLRHHFQCIESVVPGTTLVFRVTNPWKDEEVTREAFGDWTAGEIELAWTYWLNYVPEEKAASFRCGQAMFLSDAGYKSEAVSALRRVLEEGDQAVMAKWAYLRGARPDFLVRYRLLFDQVAEFERRAA